MFWRCDFSCPSFLRSRQFLRNMYSYVMEYLRYTIIAAKFTF